MIRNSVNREARHGMDLQFAGDVLAVRDDRVGGDIEMSGNFLVGHALNEADDDFALAL